MILATTHTLPWRLLGAAAAAAAAFGSGLYVGYGWRDGQAARHRLEQLEVTRMEELRRREWNAGVAADYEAHRAAQADKVITITRRAERAIRSDPWGRRPIPADGVRELLDRAPADIGAGVTDSAVPAHPGAAERHQR